jgi:uncharacterized membrane protein
MFLLPLLMGVLGALFGILVAVVTVFVSRRLRLRHGAADRASGRTRSPPSWRASGLMAAATFLGSLLTVVTVGVVNAVVWYGRLHFRLLKPAIDQQA